MLDRPSRGGEWRVALRSAAPAGAVTVALLDHHGDPVSGEAKLDVGREPRVVVLDVPKAVAESPFGVEAIHVRVLDLARAGVGSGPWDLTTSPSVFAEPGDAEGEAAAHLPVRPRGAAGTFTIGSVGRATAAPVPSPASVERRVPAAAPPPPKPSTAPSPGGVTRKCNCAPDDPLCACL